VNTTDTQGPRMRGLALRAHGTLDDLSYRDDLPRPEPGPEEVRIRLRAAALNRIDLFVVRGLPGAPQEFPWIPGADGAGVIDSAGANVSAVAPGDRVVLNPGVNTIEDEYTRRNEHPLSPGYRILGEHRAGTFAEYVCVPAINVRALPDDATFEHAAAAALVGLTAWRIVHARARVTANDQVLIWGIGGGVALAVLSLCKRIGACVWVTSSSDEKLERARALGADETINHRSGDVGGVVRARSGKRGVDVVIDSVGAATWTQSLIALGRGGRLVTCGGTSGPLVQTDVRRLFWNQWTLMGSTMGSPPEFDAIMGLFDAGQFRVPIDSVYSLDQGRAALARLERGEQFGKIVLRIP
jgi:NADPH:quinone reductase-like Zn-dependent oxidoreductase